jgi:hypothetical protein
MNKELMINKYKIILLSLKMKKVLTFAITDRSGQHYVELNKLNIDKYCMILLRCRN